MRLNWNVKKIATTNEIALVKKQLIRKILYQEAQIGFLYHQFPMFVCLCATNFFNFFIFPIGLWWTTVEWSESFCMGP